MDFWISEWISGFHSGFLDFTVDFWISGFQFGFLPTVYEISFMTDPSAMCHSLILSRSRGEKSGGRLGIKLHHGPEMVDSVSR